MSKFNLSVDNKVRIENTMKLRNRVIHGGYFPDKYEVEEAIKTVKLILEQYKVPLFIH